MMLYFFDSVGGNLNYRQGRLYFTECKLRATDIYISVCRKYETRFGKLITDPFLYYKVIFDVIVGLSR